MNKSTTLTFDSHSQHNITNSQKYKIVLLGDQSVGKTAIINRFIFDTFDGKDHPTVGIDFISKTLYYDEKSVKLQIWDTAGQERFRSLIPGYIRDCTAAVIVYDVTNKQTYRNLKRWIEDVKSERGNDVILIIIGNKTDLEHKRVVSKGEADSFAKELDVAFMEVSAKSGQNVINLFQTIAGMLPGNESHRVFVPPEENSRANRFSGMLIFVDLNITSEPGTANIKLIQDSRIKSEAELSEKSCPC